jgi:hypothetical protein
LSQIHGDIEDLAAEHLHQFPLRVLKLVMETPKGAPDGVAVVVLHEASFDPCRGVPASVPAFEKEATGVLMHRRFDEQNVGQSRG